MVRNIIQNLTRMLCTLLLLMFELVHNMLSSLLLLMRVPAHCVLRSLLPGRGRGGRGGRGVGTLGHAAVGVVVGTVVPGVGAGECHGKVHTE